MRLKPVLIAILFGAVGPTWAGDLAVSQDMLVGTWKCAAVAPMKGPGFVLELSYVTERTANLTFFTTATGVHTFTGRAPITIVDTSQGTWRLEGSTIIWTTKEVKFVSSSDPIVTSERWQKIQDDQLAKKAIDKSKVLEIDAQSMRTIPVDSEYQDAMVGTKCVRIKVAGGKPS